MNGARSCLRSREGKGAKDPKYVARILQSTYYLYHLEMKSLSKIVGYKLKLVSSFAQDCSKHRGSTALQPSFLHRRRPEKEAIRKGRWLCIVNDIHWRLNGFRLRPWLNLIPMPLQELGSDFPILRPRLLTKWPPKERRDRERLRLQKR